MQRQYNFRDLKTIPNILSLLRIVLIAPFVYFFLKENYILSSVVIGVSGLSDAFDGLIARKFNQITDIGKILDPIADKLTLIAIMVCLLIRFTIIAPLVIVLILKDVLMIVGSAILLKNGTKPPAAKWYGKIGTIMFYFSVSLIVFLKAVYGYENPALTYALLIITAVMMLFALIKYFLIFLNLKKK